jgi:hypothetical protein
VNELYRIGHQGEFREKTPAEQLRKGVLDGYLKEMCPGLVRKEGSGIVIFIRVT